MREDPGFPLFFALPMPDAVRAQAGGIQAQAGSAFWAARLPALAGIHVTLAYLGRSGRAAPELLALAAAAVQGVPGFTLTTARLGGFPQVRRARILWLGFTPEPGLQRLADRLRAGLKAAGVAFDEKPFMAHLTLARFREPVDLALGILPEPPPVTFQVQQFELFQSIAGATGNAYRPLGAVPFGCA